MSFQESLILSRLEPDDFIRFIFCPNAEGRIEISIEGGSDSDPKQLEEKIGLTVPKLRSQGYLFGRSTAKVSPSECEGVRWVEIRPRPIGIEPLRGGGIGFGSADANTGNRKLWYPELLTNLPDSLSDAPLLAAFGGEPSTIRSIEVEFALENLEPKDVPLVEGAIDSLKIPSAQARRHSPAGNPEEAFLNLWLFHRVGLRVNLRAQLEENSPTPVFHLETVGEDLFGCRCEVLEQHAAPSQSGDLTNLVNRFPRSWPFPAILPTNCSLDHLAAPKLHNLDLPKLPKQGLVIGEVEENQVRLPAESRDRHTYLVGATGTGKSTLLEQMIREDIREGRGLILLDPHGDLYHRIKKKSSVASSRLFCLDPSEDAGLPAFNILDIPATRLRHRQASFLVGELMRFFDEIWNMREAGGPMFEMYFRNTLLLMCLQNEDSEPLHLGEFARVLTDCTFRKQLLVNCPDKSVVDFWLNMAEKTGGDVRLENIAPYIASKLNGLVQTGFLSKLFCQRRNEIQIGERINRGEVILVNLNKGLLGIYESRLLGTILLMEVFSAGLARSALPEAKRCQFSVYVDEFQNFVSDNAASMLSEARKFGLRLTLANQTLAQLNAHSGKQDLLETVLGNVGNLIAFRLGVMDADRLRLFLNPFTPAEMQELPNFHALARILTPEGPIRPLVFRTLYPNKTDGVTGSRKPVTPNCCDLHQTK